MSTNPSFVRPHVDSTGLGPRCSLWDYDAPIVSLRLSGDGGRSSFSKRLHLPSHLPKNVVRLRPKSTGKLPSFVSGPLGPRLFVDYETSPDSVPVVVGYRILWSRVSFGLPTAVLGLSRSRVAPHSGLRISHHISTTLLWFNNSQ